MTTSTQCQGTRPDGSPCKAPPEFVDLRTGLCNEHRHIGVSAEDQLAPVGFRGKLATVRIKAPEVEAGFVVINVAEFDPSIHEAIDPAEGDAANAVNAAARAAAEAERRARLPRYQQ